MQDSLFNLEPYTVAPTWERWGGGGIYGRIDAVHFHVPSGWQIRHCGHPTANYPYYILTPEQIILAPNGRGFMRLELAKQHLEQLYEEQKNVNDSPNL